MTTTVPSSAPRPVKRTRRTALVLCLAMIGGSTAACSRSAPPHVVLVVMDTTRADHLSHSGWKNDTTPNLTKLLDDAVLYSRAHSTAPWTFPSHMSMFTGMLPGEHRATWAAMDDPQPVDFVEILRRPFHPPFAKRMLAVLLAQQGYDAVGISCNPWVSKRTGLDRGFDAFYPVWASPFRPDPALPTSPLELPVDSRLAEIPAAKALLAFNHHLRAAELGDKSFLFFNIIDPHYPYISDRDKGIEFGGDPEFFESMADPGQRKREIDIIAKAVDIEFDELVPFYDSSIHRADWAVGELMAWLERRGVYEDSMIIVTSDHGEHLGEQGLFSHQFSVEEELLRVPLIVKYPGNWSGGTIDANPFASVADVYATVLAAVDGSADDASYSRDLAGDFDRPYSVAEYYYSNAYLRRYLKRNPAFDVEAHQRVLRVVYTAGSKFVFENDRLAKVDPADPARPRDARLEQEMTDWMHRYVGGLNTGPIDSAATEAGMSDAEHLEFTEGLRALGYVR